MQSTRNVENVQGSRVRTDRIFPETRWVSVIIVPFLLAAFVILYLFLLIASPLLYMWMETRGNVKDEAA